MEQQAAQEGTPVREEQDASRPNLPAREKESGRKKDQNSVRPPERRRKYLPAIMMLAGGTVGSVTAYLLGYEMNVFLAITLFCLILFYVLGNVFVLMLDKFDDQIEKARMDEGEVIEKEGTEEPEETDQAGESVS